MIIGIDFDGTCVAHDYPKVRKYIGAVPILRRLVANGHQLILFTMRSDSQESKDNFEVFDGLQEAVNWFKENNIPLYGIQTNPTQKLWTNSPKAYCQLYIDDAALGCPLITDKNISNRPFINWKVVELILESQGILKK